MILSAKDLSMAFGDMVLFEDMSFSIEARDKVGIIGANGCGKTTLFNIILGKLIPESGGVVRQSGLNIGYAQQYACKDSGKSAYEETLAVFSWQLDTEDKLNTLSKELETSTDSSLIQKYNELNEEFIKRDGLVYKSKTAAALKGLGFSDTEQSLPVSALSGGQRSKVELARLLLAGPELLLLDEPTNHLDIESVSWLEDFLVAYKGAALIISHDRYFLDRVTNRTFSIEHKKMYCVDGNYTKFNQVHGMILESEAREYENTMREVRRIEGIIAQQRQWNREKNIKTAESKEKQIERMTRDLKAPEKDEPPISPTFPIRFESGNDCLYCENASVSFDGKKLFSGVNLDIKRGEHIFLVGPNGCGKTTLIKYLLQNPSVRFGVGVEKGYFDQHGMGVDATKTAFEDLRDDFPKMGNTEIRNALAAYRFSGDDVFEKIGDMSGGERARVLLCKLGLKKANFLFLDEPTNHLDLPSREALERALCEYKGTLFIVSHDRYFINSLASRILELGRDGVKSYIGNYDDYISAKTVNEASVIEVKKVSENKENYMKRKKDAAELRALKSALSKTETKIGETEAKIAEITASLGDEANMSDYQKISELSAASDELNLELEKLMTEWEQISSELEQKENDNRL